jgi:hypothetical protein
MIDRWLLLLVACLMLIALIPWAAWNGKPRGFRWVQWIGVTVGTIIVGWILIFIAFATANAPGAGAEARKGLDFLIPVCAGSLSIAVGIGSLVAAFFCRTNTR